jgi:hypothetical protein
MKVYEIKRDINHMRSLDTKTYDYEKEIQWFKGKSMKDIFCEDKEKFVVDKIKAKYMDFYAGDAKFVLTPNSYDILGPSLSKHGEFFKCEIINAPKPNNFAYFFNILTILDPYDKKLTEWDTFEDGEKYRPINIIFRRKKVTKDLFIIPNGLKKYGYKRDYFCTDGLLPPEEEFYHIYQNSGLKGFWFEEIELT